MLQTCGVHIKSLFSITNLLNCKRSQIMWFIFKIVYMSLSTVLPACRKSRAYPEGVQEPSIPGGHQSHLHLQLPDRRANAWIPQAAHRPL